MNDKDKKEYKKLKKEKEAQVFMMLEIQEESFLGFTYNKRVVLREVSEAPEGLPIVMPKGWKVVR